MNIRSSRIQSVMACLGDPSRFRIVRMLSSGEHYVLEIAEQIGLSQSCTTRHLQTLLRERLVARARRGKRVMFRLRLEEPAVAGLVEWVLQQSFHPGGIKRSSNAVAVGARSGRLQRVPKSGESGASAAAPDPETSGTPVKVDQPTKRSDNQTKATDEMERATEQRPDPYAELEDFLL